MGDKASFVNVYPFIWKEYQENGYVTGDLHIYWIFVISLLTLFYKEIHTQKGRQK